MVVVDQRVDEHELLGVAVGMLVLSLLALSATCVLGDTVRVMALRLTGGGFADPKTATPASSTAPGLTRRYRRTKMLGGRLTLWRPCPRTLKGRPIPHAPDARTAAVSLRQDPICGIREWSASLTD